VFGPLRRARCLVTRGPRLHRSPASRSCSTDPALGLALLLGGGEGANAGMDAFPAGDIVDERRLIAGELSILL
jgi:hypothetical protein